MLPVPMLLDSVLVADNQGSVPVLFGSPNISGVLRGSQASLGIFGANSDGAFSASEGNNVLNVTTKAGEGQSSMTFYANRCSSLYQDGLTEVRVNALYGLHLVRAY